MTIQTWR